MKVTFTHGRRIHLDFSRLDSCIAAVKNIPTKSSSLKQLNKKTRELESELYTEGFSEDNILANEGKPYTADQIELSFQQWLKSSIKTRGRN